MNQNNINDVFYITFSLITTDIQNLYFIFEINGQKISFLENVSDFVYDPY